MTTGSVGVKLVVLAGGQSRRMGRDKALVLRPDGATFLEGLVRAAQSSWTDVWVAGPRRPGLLEDVVHVADAEADAGPAAGILGALRASQCHVTVVPVDAALAGRELMSWLRDCHDRWVGKGAISHPHGWVAWSTQGPEPTFATWSAEATGHLAHCLAKGERSLRRIVELGQFARVDCPAELLAGFTNFNRPEELVWIGRPGAPH